MNQEVLKKNFERHEFETSFFETREQAATYLQAQIRGQKVAFGGSVTLQEMGLFDALSKENEVIWHWNEPGAKTLAKAREAQIYITSANGVSETGELVNIDGTGNRVAQTLYGPEKVYFVVGKNKIEKDLSAALSLSLIHIFLSRLREITDTMWQITERSIQTLEPWRI